MKDDKALKNKLQEIQREISNVNYFVSNISVNPKDRQSAKNLNHARMALANLERIARQDLKILEKAAEARIEEDSQAKFKQALGTINSPSTKMIKSANDFVDSGKSSGSLIKKAIAEQIRKAGISNETRSTVGNRQHRAGDR
jgi:hypothetical protein